MKKLKVGDSAPHFWERGVRGEIVNLDKHSTKYKLIAFLRYSGCPWCNLAVHRLTLEHKLLKDSGCDVIAIMPSKKENIQKNIYDRHAKTPDFPMIADEERELYRKYGVAPSIIKTVQHLKHLPHWVTSVREEGFKQEKVDGNAFLAPAVFLVDEDQVIVSADYNANLYEHETFTKIYESIAAHRLV